MENVASPRQITSSHFTMSRFGSPFSISSRIESRLAPDRGKKLYFLRSDRILGIEIRRLFRGEMVKK